MARESAFPKIVMTKSLNRALWAAPVPRVFSRAARDLSQAENLFESGPLSTVEGPLANTQKKTCEIIVNLCVDG